MTARVGSTRHVSCFIVLFSEAENHKIDTQNNQEENEHLKHAIFSCTSESTLGALALSLQLFLILYILILEHARPVQWPHTRTETAAEGKKMDVFFYETFREEAKYLDRYLPASVKAGFAWQTIQEYGDREPPAPLVSIRTQSRVPVSWEPRLKGVLTRSTGYDHVLAFLQQCPAGLPCGHLPPYSSRAVAEQAMLMWMALMRNLAVQTGSFLQFNRDGLTGRECGGKTLVVVGVGNIGHEVVAIGKGLGMRVLGVDLVKRHDTVEYVSIDQGLAEADVIVCAMNLTPENRSYFTYDRLKQARPLAVFVNISRGEQSPSADLLRLLDEKRLGGVGLDVFNHEDELAGSLRAGRTSSDREVQSTLKLCSYANVILTPHNGFNTVEALTRKARLTAEQVEQFLRLGTFRWPVVPQKL
jgi:D-lactate dehydrogenase